MKIRSRLKHGASGLLARFISRNNDYQGFWTLGVLYSIARAAPWRVELNLISGMPTQLIKSPPPSLLSNWLFCAQRCLSRTSPGIP
jgi:hypothetical protein